MLDFVCRWDAHLSHDVALLDGDDGHGDAQAFVRENLRHAGLVAENPHTRVKASLDLKGRRASRARNSGADGGGERGAHEAGGSGSLEALGTHAALRARRRDSSQLEGGDSGHLRGEVATCGTRLT